MSEEKEYKPVTVDKPIPNTFDLGNLATFDPNPLDNAKLKSDTEREEYLSSITRDNVQLLINQILSLPVKTTTDSQISSTGQNSTMTLIQLPEPTTQLPREKAIPKAKAPTKWEQFAAKKGIKPKAKEGKMVYDEASGEWVPKWGYKGKNKDLDNQWLVEVDDKVKNTSDELIDPRTLKRAERKKLIKKNELQHKRNLKNASA
jgi:regulator of ribosome biosynthesis